MATIDGRDERLAERDEVPYPTAHLIDNEPFYGNFASIHNVLQQRNDGQSIHRPSSANNNRSDTTHRAVLVQVKPSNLNNRLDTHQQQSTGPMSTIAEETTAANGSESNGILHRVRSAQSPLEQTDEKRFNRDIQRMYGLEDMESNSSVSSRRSSITEQDSNSPEKDNHPQTPTPLSMLNDAIDSEVKPCITIREYYTDTDKSALIVNRSLSSASSQQTLDDNAHILAEYERFMQQHPELNHDPNPGIVIKANPDERVYKQNVSVRYLVPPTPPPPGALIIREIVPPRRDTPSPMVVHHQHPAAATPSPLILREAPPPLPPHQEATVINKFIQSDTSADQPDVTERYPPLPPKPQSIIIEKWLPYKPAPPREVIYEYITETPVVAEFQPTDRPAESSSRIPIPVRIERQNSLHQFSANESMSDQLSLFEQFARSTQQIVDAMQRQTIEQINTHQQWIASQWQRHPNAFIPMVPPLTTPTLIVNHPPVTMPTSSYILTDNIHRHHLLEDSSYSYPFYA